MFPIDHHGYVVDVSKISTSFSGKDYYDIKLKTSASEFSVIRMMVRSNPAIDRSLFIEKMQSGEPTTFKNIEQGKLDIGFYNSYRGSTFTNGSAYVNFKIDDTSHLTIADLK